MSKINQVLQKVPRGGLFFSSWMEKQGISYELQRIYRESKWFRAVANGVMVRTNEQPSIYGALACLNEQLNKQFYIAAMTALELKGFSHFAQMRRPNFFVGTPKDNLPAWVKEKDWDANLIAMKSNYFSDDVGLEIEMQGEYKLLVSSTERAFLECLNLTPKYFSLIDLFYVMEQLTTLRPQFLQQLLEKQKSVKIKRLFLYMAEKAKHLWFEDLDLNNIDLGKGKRMLSSSAGGAYDKKYEIVIPRELVEYE